MRFSQVIIPQFSVVQLCLPERRPRPLNKDDTVLQVLSECEHGRLQHPPACRHEQAPPEPEPGHCTSHCRAKQPAAATAGGHKLNGLVRKGPSFFFIAHRHSSPAAQGPSQTFPGAAAADRPPGTAHKEQQRPQQLLVVECCIWHSNRQQEEPQHRPRQTVRSQINFSGGGVFVVRKYQPTSCSREQSSRQFVEFVEAASGAAAHDDHH